MTNVVTHTKNKLLQWLGGGAVSWVVIGIIVAIFTNNISSGSFHKGQTLEHSVVAIVLWPLPLAHAGSGWACNETSISCDFSRPSQLPNVTVHVNPSTTPAPKPTHS